VQVLAVKQDVLPSSIDDATLGAMLFDAARTIATDHDLAERAATDALTAWLRGNGVMLRYDAVELRRQLVDWQFVVRDGFGRAYRRADTYPARFADVCAMAETLDFAQIINEARMRHAEQRLARKQAHLARQAV
jgi:hypothetical protein